MAPRRTRVSGLARQAKAVEWTDDDDKFVPCFDSSAAMLAHQYSELGAKDFALVLAISVAMAARDL